MLSDIWLFSQKPENAQLHQWIRRKHFETANEIVEAWEEIQFDKIWNQYPQIQHQLHIIYLRRKNKLEKIWKKCFYYLTILVVIGALLFGMWYQKNQGRKQNTSQQQDLYNTLSSKNGPQNTESKHFQTFLKGEETIPTTTDLFPLRDLYKDVDAISMLYENRWYKIGPHLIHIQASGVRGLRFIELKTRKVYNVKSTKNQTKSETIRTALKEFLLQIYSKSGGK